MAEFNAAKLISILIRNEGKASDLYYNLSKQMKEGAGEQIFKILAEDEKNHARIYSELLEKVEKSQSANITTEDSEYLDSLIVNDMFAHGEKAIEVIEGKYTEDEALQLAEKLERDGIIYVLELMKMFPDLAPKEMKKILNEEKRHLQAVLSKANPSAVRYLRY